MNEIMKVFNNSEFGEIRTVIKDDGIYFAGKDIAEALGYKDTVNALKAHVDEDDKLTWRITTSGQARNMTVINESGVYALVFGSKLTNAKQFKRWVTSEVLPELRKTGSYSLTIPKTLPEALRAYADEVESHNATKAIVAQQEQQIAEFKPVKDYVDKILSSKSCLAITQIAADYGLSAQELNKILHEAGLQRKVGDQWILYKQHMAKGFTKSETFTFCRSDGRLDSKIMTKWTQKGRLEIHSILTKLNIHAVCEDVA